MWWYVVYFIVALVIAFAMMPKPESQNAKVGTIDGPTAAEGREIPVLFGTKVVKQANIVWYGDIKTVAIKKKGGKK